MKRKFVAYEKLHVLSEIKTRDVRMIYRPRRYSLSQGSQYNIILNY